MKYFNSLKRYLLVTFLGAAAVANAQTQQPWAYGYIGTDSANYYKDYVGVRFQVTSPLSIAGQKNCVEANNNAADGWTNMTVVTTPLVNVPIVMNHTADSLGGSTFPAGSMTGKICVIWRGVTEFGQKASNAEAAGAIACVIINDVPGGGPLGMLAGTYGGTVSIPTFMIGYADGQAITAAYADSLGSVTLTITPWGLDLGNDLGFVPSGYAVWHDYAIPANQVMAPGKVPYLGLDGAFVANYGTNTETNTNLSANVSYTPTGGSATTIYTGSETLASFPAIDSIFAIYDTMQYDMASHITGPGTINVAYTISSDSTDQNPSDNTASYSIYLTDSLYSKGRYDFVNNHPIADNYEAPGVSTTDFYLWGPMYYVANGHVAINNVTWSMTSSTDTGVILNGFSIGAYVFQWVDGSTLHNSANVPDSIIENGELNLVGGGIYPFGGTNPADTSGGFFTVAIGDSNGNTATVLLDSNSWYFVAPELPVSASGDAGTWFLGIDGSMNNYPRTYGRANFHDYIEYPFIMWPGGCQQGSNLLSASPDDEFAWVLFGGTSNTDSVIFNTQVGLVPAVPFTTTSHFNTTGVSTLNPAFASIQLYPNPTADYINAALSLNQTAQSVTYTIIDASARVISKVVHNNVMSETYTFNTNKLPNGNYFMTIVADGKQVFRKFTVIR